MNNFINNIFWSTIEDDAGLWELVWEVKSSLTDLDNNVCQTIARQFLEFLIDSNLVAIYESKWGSSELKRLNFKESKEAINKNEFWQPPSIDEICIKVGATDLGEKLYNQKNIG